MFHSSILSWLFFFNQLPYFIDSEQRVKRAIIESNKQWQQSFKDIFLFLKHNHELPHQNKHKYAQTTLQTG